MFADQDWEPVWKGERMPFYVQFFEGRGQVRYRCEVVEMPSADATGRLVASGSGDTKEEARLAAREGTNDDRVRRALDEAAESSD